MEETAEAVLREILGKRFDELGEATRAIILKTPAVTIRKAHVKLLELGLTPEKIASQAQLLGRDPDTIQRNADCLKGLGLTPENIVSRAELLSMNPDTIQRNADCLKELGLTPEKIASRADLLGRNPDAIQKNYEFLRRFFTKKTICNQAQLLGSSSETVESSVQYLHSLGVDHEKYASPAATSVGCKRKKLLVILKERYGFSADLSQSEKKELLEKARAFVRSNPVVLSLSEKTIRKKFALAA